MPNTDRTPVRVYNRRSKRILPHKIPRSHIRFNPDLREVPSSRHRAAPPPPAVTAPAADTTPPGTTADGDDSTTEGV